MISLEDFVKSIQTAILEANDAIRSRNEDFLNNFFELADEGDPVEAKLKEAIKAARKALESEDTDKMEQAAKSLKVLQNAVKGGKEAEPIKRLGRNKPLTPKTVSLVYPMSDEKGNIVNKEVEVPLVTMVPMLNTVIEEVRLNTEIEIWLDGDKVKINFGKINRSADSKSKLPDEQRGIDLPKRTIGSLDIVLKGNETPAGLKHIIEGYEKALKAQLPN